MVVTGFQLWELGFLSVVWVGLTFSPKPKLRCFESNLLT